MSAHFQRRGLGLTAQRSEGKHTSGAGQPRQQAPQLCFAQVRFLPARILPARILPARFLLVGCRVDTASDHACFAIEYPLCQRQP